MHGPDGGDCPNESRFARIEADRAAAIEHLSDHHFLLTLELAPVADGTEHYQKIAPFVATANLQNLERLAAEVARIPGAPEVRHQGGLPDAEASVNFWRRKRLGACATPQTTRIFCASARV